MRKASTTSFAWVVAALRALICVLALAPCAHAQVEQRSSIVPQTMKLEEAASRAINAEWLTDEERAELRIFHGVWDERDLLNPRLKALAALLTWDLNNPVFDDASAPVEWRAEAVARRGALEAALTLLQDAHSNLAARLRAEAYETLGEHESALDATDRAVESMLRDRTSEAAELTEGVRAMIIRARLQGQPARDYQSMMRLLAQARDELDRLHWPAMLTEAELLLDKDNMPEAVGALHQVLALNPRASEAWYMLGRIALQRFDFIGTQTAADMLRRMNREHPLAQRLEAELRLTQNDPEGALELLTPLAELWPRMRDVQHQIAAAHAILYDEAALQGALARCEELSPGGAQAYFAVGRQLSFNRQYAKAGEVLREAIRRQPNWPAPQIELGLMQLQAGENIASFDTLERVRELDPFNVRAANTLFLLEELGGYETIETPHFIIRFKPGVDRVLVELMPEQLERLHEIVSSRFTFEPNRKTQIEVLPDHQRFGVFITGMPWIHTIAACTGPVIAMEVPREGNPKQHLGLFDWPRVLQHEYTHTITLAQTQNRIPHWLTEAAAVSMELAPRDYDRCTVLADAWREDTLFDLDEINWAFIRPKQPRDRGKAYAQGHWMVEYMDERFGESALITLLEHYSAGAREAQAIPAALGISRQEFFDGFRAWAGAQVESWGLASTPSLEELTDELRAQDPELEAALALSKRVRLQAIAKRLGEEIGLPERVGRTSLKANDWPDLLRPPVEITMEQLDGWLAEHPDHADLWELKIRRMLDDHDAAALSDELIAMLERYAQLRPVDPMPHRELAQHWLASETPQKAIPHLEYLDAREEKTPAFAVQLAKLYRSGKRPELATGRIERAVSIDPYHAPTRELAAALCIEAGALTQARRHIFALTLLEPDRPQHEQRLQRIDEMLGAQPR